MKNYKLNLILSAVIILIFASCSKDFLDRPPLDQEVTTNFYQTEEDAMAALVAVYDVFGYQSSPGVSWAPFLTVSDILSDDSFAGGADANDGQDENELKTKIAETKNVGKSKPCIFEIRDKSLLSDFEKVMLFKIKSK